MASTTAAASRIAAHDDDASLPLLQREAATRPAPAPATLPPAGPPACTAADSAAAGSAAPVSSDGSQHLLIEASLATFPTTVIGHPVVQHQGGAGLIFLPDDLAAAAALPSVLALWQQQRSLLVAWLLASMLSLLLWAPLSASNTSSGASSSPLALVAQLTAVMGCAASGLTLLRRSIRDGHELHAQLRVVSVCGGLACALDVLASLALTASLWSLSCAADDQACFNAASYTLLLGLCSAGHAYASLAAASRARALLVRLDPVSSGVVAL